MYFSGAILQTEIIISMLFVDHDLPSHQILELVPVAGPWMVVS